jgi:predicted nucleotidyltransferase
MSAMGALKIARRLEKEHILDSKQLGKAIFYKLTFNNEYTKQYLSFLLKREAETAQPYIKRWITEIRKIKNADITILFGSVLRKQKEANDIDVVYITDQKRFEVIKKEIETINTMNPKKIHPIYQTRKDFSQNIKKGDKIILDALKGIIVYGEDMLIKVMQHDTSSK